MSIIDNGQVMALTPEQYDLLLEIGLIYRCRDEQGCGLDSVYHIYPEATWEDVINALVTEGLAR